MTSLHEASGWLGGALLAVCAIPQVVQCVREGHARGISWLFLGMWLSGEVFTMAYVWPKQDWVLLMNYVFNIALLAVILRYRIWPRGEAPTQTPRPAKAKNVVDFPGPRRGPGEPPPAAALRKRA